MLHINHLFPIRGKERAGIITSIRIDPYDNDIRDVQIYFSQLNHETHEVEHRIERIKVTAREAQKARLLTEKTVVWHSHGKPHRANQEELVRLHIIEGELQKSYHDWLNQQKLQRT